MPLPSDRRKLETVASSFRGLGHPTRLQILEALRHSDVLSPKQLVELVEPSITLGTMSHHTRELRSVGLLAGAGTRPVRGALQHFYRLSPRGRELMELVDRLVV
jgi:DNA-binding transcriptional ArsR family regulator